MTDKIKAVLSAISGGRCWYCGGTGPGCAGAPTSMAVDHVLPRCRGGKDELSNGALACWGCNSLKAGHSLEWLRERLGALVGEEAGWFTVRDRISRYPSKQWPTRGRMVDVVDEDDGPAYVD